MSTTDDQEELDLPFNSDGQREWDLYLASSAHPSVRKLLKDPSVKGNALGEACIKVIETQLNLHDFQKRMDNSTIHDVSLQGEGKSGDKKISLFDHAAMKIASQLGRDPEEDEQLLKELEKIPSIQKASNHWDRIPYASKLLLGTADGKVALQGGDQLDEWIQRNEKYMRARLCLDETPTNLEEPEAKRSKTADLSPSPESVSPDWKRWMVGLGRSGDLVFGSKSQDGIRTTERPSLESLNGIRLLDAKREAHIKTRDLQSFKTTFNHMSGDILKGLDWSNVLVAGGMILAALTSTTLEDEEKAKAADLDVYLFGLNEEETIKKLHHLESTYASNLPEGETYAVLRNSRTITFVPSKFPIRRLQVVLKICSSPMEILLNFDLDPVGMGFDGEEVWMLARAARSLVTGYTSFTMDLIHGHYLNDRRASQDERVFKYARRGYGIRFLPSYVDSILSISPNKPDPVKTLESILEDQREKVKWFIAVQAGWSDTTIEVKHSDVDSREYRFAEMGDKNCLTSASLFFRHVALWELAQAGKIKLDESTSSFSEAVYHDDPLDYNEGPDLDWNEEFSLDKFKRMIEESNEEELGLLESHVQHLYETELPRDWEDEGEPKTESFFPRLEIRRSIVEDRLSKALERDIRVSLYAPESFLKFSQSILPEGSFDPIAQAKLEEEKLSLLKSRPTGYWGRPEPAPEVEAEYKLVYWTRKGPLFQLIDRRVDEVIDILHAFRKGHSKIERDLPLREGLVRRFLTRRAVAPTLRSEMEAFKVWTEVQMPHHESYYQNDEAWFMFNVPPEIREKRFELTEEELQEMEDEMYFGTFELSFWQKAL